MRAKATVILSSPAGESVVVRPGDEFPEWANVTNQAVIADEPAPRSKPAPRKRRTAKAEGTGDESDNNE